jgi:hypothetical protein
MNMDVLGIKDPIASLQATKKAKKNPSEWTKQEILADNKMVVIFQPATQTTPGHYTCKIPWKTEKPLLVNNASQIRQRQARTMSPLYLHRKGASEKEIYEYFDKLHKADYIEQLPRDAQTDPDCYFLPWFPVIDRTRESTKMRMVFDAAAKDKEGKCLNSEIENTPNRLNDLLVILLRFRRYKTAVTADISEMFLRIRMEEQDKRYHRFYLGQNVWQWKSIIFGEKSSPDISQKVVRTCAIERGLERAKRVIDEAMYMDDMIDSFIDTQEAIDTSLEIIGCLKEANMNITKFYSNSKEVIDALPKDLLSKKVSFKEKDTILEASKVLGLNYRAEDDTFYYKCKFQDMEEFFEKQKIEKPKDWTKRLILRFSATCYDPPGFISPFTVRAKSVLQRLWNIKLGWDDGIPESFSLQWQQWLKEMFNLEGLISIPRHLKLDQAKGVCLHVFVDASTDIFAAVAYLVVKTEEVVGVESMGVLSKGVKDEKQLVRTSFITAAKARVTPTKTESISRLELAACVIGVRLGHTVAKCYDLDPEDNLYWTDSMNCMFWLNTPANTLKTFVAHRVGEIQNHSKVENWRHVPTEINPADIPTRKPSVEELAANRAWWKGPEFLTKEEEEWPPRFIPNTCTDDAKIEFRKFAIMTVDRKPVCTVERALNPERYSVGEIYDGYKRLVRVTAIFLGLLVRVFLTPKATKEAIYFQCRRAQRDSEGLSELITQIETKTKIQNRRYIGLDPFLDESGLLRSKSRLSECLHLCYDMRHPIILDKEGRFTKLLVQHYHREFGHAVGEEMIKAELRQKFYIIGLNQMVRAARTGCKTCDIRRAKPFQQKMSPLPKYRFEEPLRAFAKTGLDFAGPFETKFGRGRARKKVYILVLTCMQTRAVHLEVTDSVDLTAVMNALSRFVDIRGMPTDILSDNFSTFISQDKELQDWVRNLDFSEAIDPVKTTVNWHFTPPHAPHHGGIYESMVKATKRALKTISDKNLLDLDEFRTFVSRSAALLNGRPLTRVVEDATTKILTPNHFLMGSLGGAVTTEHLIPTKRWKIISSLQTEFWELFQKNYLHDLKRLRKWKIINPEIRIDQMVIENLPSLGTGCWRLARVIELIPSEDGIVRKVRIKTSNGEFERAITSLSPLELD